MAEVDITEYNGGALVGTAIALLVVTSISVGLRTFVRVFLTTNFQADDWLMLVAQAIFTISCIFILLGVGRGLGYHNAALEQGDEIAALMWQALATATYVLNMMFIKLSIAIFLLRLALERRYRYTLLGSMAVITVWSLVLFFWDLFQCHPVRAQWDYTLTPASCVSSGQVVSAAYALSVMTIVTDWLYALLPIPMVWNVKMTVQAKTTVVVLLGLGIFASIATLIRLKFLADLNDTDDILYAGTASMVWTLVEPGVAIVASSLVTIRPLLHALKIKGFMSTEGSNTRQGGYGGGGAGTSGRRSAAAANAMALSSSSSTTNQKTRRGGMPGFGPADITLVDLGSSGETTVRGGSGGGEVGLAKPEKMWYETESRSISSLLPEDDDEEVRVGGGRGRDVGRSMV